MGENELAGTYSAILGLASFNVGSLGVTAATDITNLTVDGKVLAASEYSLSGTTLGFVATSKPTTVTFEFSGQTYTVIFQ